MDSGMDLERSQRRHSGIWGRSVPAPRGEITSQEMREGGTETLISISLQIRGGSGARAPRKHPRREGVHPSSTPKIRVEGGWRGGGSHLRMDFESSRWEWGELSLDPTRATGKTSRLFPFRWENTDGKRIHVRIRAVWEAGGTDIPS